MQVEPVDLVLDSRDHYDDCEGPNLYCAVVPLDWPVRCRGRTLIGLWVQLFRGAAPCASVGPRARTRIRSGHGVSGRPTVHFATEEEPTPGPAVSVACRSRCRTPAPGEAGAENLA